MLDKGMSKEDKAETLLKQLLPAAVPLYIMRMEAKGGPQPEDIKKAQNWGEAVIGPGGERLIYGMNSGSGKIFRPKSKVKQGSPELEDADIEQAALRNITTADLFNGMAHTIAVLSFCPGGVTVFNMDFEARPSQSHSSQSEPNNDTDNID
jgi:hypothetical protein